MRGQQFWCISAFVLGAATYYYVEEAYKQSKRKNPLDYQFEVDPNTPLVCRMPVDIDTRGSKADTQVDKIQECDPNSPPDTTKKGPKTKAKK